MYDYQHEEDKLIVILRKIYEKGLEDAWTLATTIDYMSPEQKMRIFGSNCGYDTFKNLGVNTAIRLFEAYKEEQKNKEQKKEKEKHDTIEKIKYLDNFCRKSHLLCKDCPLYSGFKCGRGYTWSLADFRECGDINKAYELAKNFQNHHKCDARKCNTCKKKSLYRVCIRCFSSSEYLEDERITKGYQW